MFVFHPSQINAIPEQLSVNSCSTGVAASSATLGNSCLTNERSECYSAKLSALNSQEEGDQSREQELLLSRLESLWLQLQMLLEGTKTYNRSLATKFLQFSYTLLFSDHCKPCQKWGDAPSLLKTLNISHLKLCRLMLWESHFILYVCIYFSKGSLLTLFIPLLEKIVLRREVWKQKS